MIKLKELLVAGQKWRHISLGQQIVAGIIIIIYYYHKLLSLYYIIIAET